MDEAVDIKAYDGGYKVGIIKDGEYLRYSVVVTEDGSTNDFSDIHRFATNDTMRQCFVPISVQRSPA